MKHTHKLIVATAFLGLVSVANAQNPFQAAYENACPRDATKCGVWIKEMEQSPQGKSEDAQLMIGAGYAGLADFAADPRDKAAFQARAREVYAGIVKQNPASLDGILGLATLAETEDERIDYLRQRLAVDPTNTYSLEALAQTLSATNRTPERLSEAAELMERAYENYRDAKALKKWYLAAAAISLYRDAGRKNDSDNVRAHARQAYGYDDALARVSRPELMNAEELNSTLTSICEYPVIWFGGAKGCLDSLRTTANAVDKAPSNNAGKLAEAASLGMRAAAEVGALLSEVDPGWRESFTDSLEKFVTSGHATPNTFGIYGALVPDRHKRLEVMEAGAAKFPNNAELAMAAGLAELDLGHRDDAVRNLTRAKTLSPGAHPDIDQFLERANKL